MDLNSLIEQFSQLNLSEMNPTIKPPAKEHNPDIKELFNKAQRFRKELKKLGQKRKDKENFIKEVKQCISQAKFSQKNIDRVQEGIRRANPGVGELEPIDWVLTLEILVNEVIVHRIHRIDFGDHDVNMKVKGLLSSIYRAGSKNKMKMNKRSQKKVSQRSKKKVSQRSKKKVSQRSEKKRSEKKRSEKKRSRKKRSSRNQKK